MNRHATPTTTDDNMKKRDDRNRVDGDAGTRPRVLRAGGKDYPPRGRAQGHQQSPQVGERFQGVVVGFDRDDMMRFDH